jgi:hypothetical protein
MTKKKDVGQARKRTAKKSPGVRAKASAKRVKRLARAPALTYPPPATVVRIQELNRERRALERAIDSQREKTLAAYRREVTRLEARRAAPLMRVFAEGDSWFNYPLGHAVISHLQGLIKTPIANFAWPGAETRQLLALHERREIEKRFTEGAEAGRKFDVLLFSGGGDDIVGDQMCLFLNRYDPRQPPEKVLNDRFEEVLDLVMGAYKDLVSLRNALSSNTLIVGHVYDYAWATGKRACWLGPWLQPSLDYVGVPRGELQHAVVIEMLKRFETKLKAVAAVAGKFLVVSTHGTLQSEDEWANELHPKDPGFLKIARKFQELLQQQFGADI